MTSFLESCAVAMSVSESMRSPSVRLNAAIQSLTSMDVASAAREINVSGGRGLDDLGDRLKDQVDADGANQDGDKQAG